MIKYMLLFLPFLSFAQTELVEGFVVDFDNGKKIKNADIYFQQNSYGTISNAEGFFTFDCNKISTSDTLIISHLGYKEYKIKVEDFLHTKKKIYLIAHTFELDEITITSIDPLEVLKQTLENYDANHFSENTIYSGSIKLVSEVNKTITRFAYTDILLKIPKRNSKNTKFFPTQNQWKKKNVNLLNDFLVTKLNLLANHLKIKNQLAYYLDNYKKFDEVSISEKKYGSHNVYEIFLEKKIDHLKKTTVAFFIEKESRAILSMKIEGDRGEPVDRWITVSDEDNEQISRIPTYSIGDIIFRPYKDKWILKEVRADLNVSYIIESNGQEQNLNTFNYVTIVIDGIQSDKGSNQQKAFDLSDDIFTQIKSTSFPHKHKLDTRELEFLTK